MDDNRRRILLFGDPGIETTIMHVLDILKYDIRTPLREWDQPEHRFLRNTTNPTSPEFLETLLMPIGRGNSKYFAVIVDRSFMEALPVVREIGYKGHVIAITSQPYDAKKKERMQPPFDAQKEWECGLPEGADAAVPVYPAMKFEDKMNWTLDKLAKEK